MLNKSLFTNFLYLSPTDDDLADAKRYLRESEISNMIDLCNIINEEILHRWDPTKTEHDTTQHQMNRMFSSKSMMAWSELLKDAIAAKLDIGDRDEKDRIFYREIYADDVEKIRRVVRRLIEWGMWQSPNTELDSALNDNRERVKDFFRANSLTVGYLVGASE
jgi:hypothetical protein